MTPAPDEYCDLPAPGGAPATRPATDLGEGALVYGKAGCPHTRRALAALPRARFIDVLADPAALAEMLALTGGLRRVPVIRRGEHVEVGFRRGS